MDKQDLKLVIAVVAIIVGVVMGVVLYTPNRGDPRVPGLDSTIHKHEERIFRLQWDSTRIARQLRSVQIKASYDSARLTKYVIKLKLAHDKTQFRISKFGNHQLDSSFKSRFPQSDSAVR